MQATKSVLEQYLGSSAFEQSGQRVVEGQRLIQATSDMFLGWSRWQANDGKQVEYADGYADCTWADHAQLQAAINDGHIEVVRDLDP